MPNNFRHLGLIHLMLPNAKIIDARREPMACCFSNFKQLFASGQQFTYSVEDITRYYRMYVELMAHWDEVLPGKKSCACNTRTWSRISRATCGGYWISAASNSSRLRRIPQDPAHRPYCQLGTGPSAHQSGRQWISGVTTSPGSPL
jgi:hypothetical protein